ncbi:hypothetical protein F0L74_15030 [Chitinophaga agrisoli]|uniref:DUF4846 domain-containing protein n=2 Tax=Chitinophaga agrisoli TaxID=2607653 RepID=A0A5B2VY02_9BACT|nr:hypothetical protein F0L74_15030 [Chitinophaga agrisoli]
MRYFFPFFIFLVTTSPSQAQTVADIAAPAGFNRLEQPAGAFGAWLRKIPLKKDKTVYLYNGKKKTNQQAQFAVLDVSVGKKDLQQCADAVMRLYAEYRFAAQQYDKIVFHATDGTRMDYDSWRQGTRFVLQKGRLVRRHIAAASNSRASFDQYLNTVFSYAGTLSLSKELKKAEDILPGDVFITGGSPGHAVIVTDVAVNKAGRRQFLLAQSYMPAQDIHILVNPAHPQSPWYEVSPAAPLITPEWDFAPGSLKRFPW